MPQHLPRLLCACVILLAALVSVPITRAADFVVPAPTTAEDIATAATWFDTLDLPDLREKLYVEITWAHDLDKDGVPIGPKVRGFLLAEDDKAYTLFVDGTLAPRISSFFAIFPCAVQKVPKLPPSLVGESKKTMRVIPLADAIKERIAEEQRPKDQEDRHNAYFGRAASPRTTFFILARCCARQGHADLARELDAAIIAMEPIPQYQGETKPRSLREFLAGEIVKALMWKALVDFGDASVTRPELLAEFTRIVHDFPPGKDEKPVAAPIPPLRAVSHVSRGIPVGEHYQRAVGFVEVLRQLIAEDEAHARTARPIAEMNEEEKIRELIFQLRNQNGHQHDQPGSCDIFEWAPGVPARTPADQLVELRYAAVPALITALEDQRPTRSVGFNRDFRYSHYILTVSDCARLILARIADRDFAVWGKTSADLEVTGGMDIKATQAAAQKWWRGVQAKGEKGMLIEGVSQGNAQQAFRLIEFDPAAALDAILSGLRVTKGKWGQARLVEQLARIKSPDATKALREQMKKSPSFHARIIAAGALFRRGEKDAVPALIAEWKKWKPEPDPEEKVDPLIVCLATCDDPAAMQSLIDRYPTLHIDDRLEILEALSGRYLIHDSLWPEATPPNPPTPHAPEVEALIEKTWVAALDDRAIRTGSSGFRDQTIYHDPRVCEMAALLLAERWPDRYRFTWPGTRMERDAEIIQAQNVWATAHDLKPRPVPERHAHEAAAREPNTISSLQWSPSALVEGVRLAEGQALTADAFIETLALLHRNLPGDIAGFDLSAERAGDNRGFFITIDWIPGPHARPDSAKAGDRQPTNPSGVWMSNAWNQHADISLGKNTLLNSDAGAPAERRTQPASFEEEKLALTKALAADPAQSISITINSRRTKE